MDLFYHSHIIDTTASDSLTTKGTNINSNCIDILKSFISWNNQPYQTRPLKLRKLHFRWIRRNPWFIDVNFSGFVAPGKFEGVNNFCNLYLTPSHIFKAHISHKCFLIPYRINLLCKQLRREMVKPSQWSNPHKNPWSIICASFLFRGKSHGI